MRNNRYIIILLLLIGIYPLMAQTSSNDALRERIYLQTDKQVYLAGELVWLKAVTTSTDGKPLTFSKLAYVELLDEATSQVQLKLDLYDGAGEGWMILPASLSSGYYRLIAYTRYMRNESTDVFFEKNIAVINTTKTEDEAPRTGAKPTAVAETNRPNTITLSTDRTVYGQRDQVQIVMDNLPDDVHTLSVSVTGREPLAAEQMNMSQWHRNLASVASYPVKKEFLPEYEGHIVSAKLMDIATNTPKYEDGVAPFISFSGDQIRLYAGQVDKDANVSFYTSRIDGMKELVSTLSNYTGNKYRIDLQPPYITNHSKKQLPSLNIDSTYAGHLLERSVALQALYAYTSDTLNNFRMGDSYFTSPPDRSYLLDEYTRFVTMQEVITEFVLFVRFRKIYGKRFLSVYREGIGYSEGNTLVILDGIPIFDHDIIYDYNPLLIKRLDTYQGRYVFGGQMFDGIVAFTTYHNDYPGLELDESTQFFDYEGTQAHRPFYQPSYATEAERQSRVPDFRHTLYWNPMIDVKGKSNITLPFYTSDLPGEYRITVEGITKEGRIVQASSVIKVE